MYSITIFKNMYDNKTHRRLDIDTWDQFTNFLYKLSQRPLKGKRDAELISPATYQAGTTRANKNVIDWAGWAAVDVDDHVFDGDLENELRTRYGNWDYICYSTASSTRDTPKFRLVFPLTSHIEQQRIRHFWYALNTELGSIGDIQTKDLSRMYYVPATYAGAYNFFFSNIGRPIAVDDLLDKYQFEDKSSKNFLDRLPDEWRRQIIEHRKSALENTSIYWNGYQDCPFINKKIMRDWNSIANVDGTGRYSMLYKIMVSIAMNAIKENYPITSQQIVALIRQLDMDTSRKYENRALDVEAENALEYAYRNV
jgi:hypothetical protein